MMTDAAKSSALLAANAIDGRRRVAGRTAQFLLGIPLGLLQLAAVIGFTVTGAAAGESWLVVIWGLLMSTACAMLALRIYRSAGARRVSFTLLGAQALFSLMKLTVYHESASLVFMAIIAVTAAALFTYHRAAAA
jgi:hypothetical protein